MARRLTTTHGRYRLGSATRTFSTRFATRSLRRIDLRISGADYFRLAKRYGTWPGSIRFDAQELHDLTPFLGFVGDELGEVRGRGREHGTTEVGKPRLHLGIGEAGVDLLVELVDDLRRRVLGYADAISGQVPDITDRRPHHC